MPCKCQYNLLFLLNCSYFQKYYAICGLVVCELKVEWAELYCPSHTVVAAVGGRHFEKKAAAFRGSLLLFLRF